MNFGWSSVGRDVQLDECPGPLEAQFTQRTRSLCQVCVGRTVHPDQCSVLGEDTNEMQTGRPRQQVLRWGTDQSPTGTSER